MNALPYIICVIITIIILAIVCSILNYIEQQIVNNHDKHLIKNLKSYRIIVIVSSLSMIFLCWLFINIQYCL